MQSKLPTVERAICERLREAREFVGVTQAECARQLGILRGTLVNYESGRSPLRVNLALRFCRTFIVSEEWLATGQVQVCRDAHHANGFDMLSELTPAKQGISVFETLIYKRLCMDLFSETATHPTSPSALFSTAWEGTLEPIYKRLFVNAVPWMPRLTLHAEDAPHIGINFLTALHQQSSLMIKYWAELRQKYEGHIWQTYVLCLSQSSLQANALLITGDNAKRVDPMRWIKPLFEYPSLDGKPPRKKK